MSAEVPFEARDPAWPSATAISAEFEAEIVRLAKVSTMMTWLATKLWLAGVRAPDTRTLQLLQWRVWEQVGDDATLSVFTVGAGVEGARILVGGDAFLYSKDGPSASTGDELDALVARVKAVLDERSTPPIPPIEDALGTLDRARLLELLAARRHRNQPQRFRFAYGLCHDALLWSPPEALNMTSEPFFRQAIALAADGDPRRVRRELVLGGFAVTPTGSAP